MSRKIIYLLCIFFQFSIFSMETPLSKESDNFSHNRELGEKLLEACDSGDLNQIKKYLHEGADINYRGGFRDIFSPILNAIMGSHYEVVEFLIERGAKLDELDNFGRSLLCHARNKKILLLLIKNGLDINHKDTALEAIPIHWFSLHGRLEMVQTVIDMGSDINARDKRGFTPLFWACYSSRLPSVKFLLEHGAKFDTKSLNAATPLHIACLEENPELILFLIARGADINAQDKYGNTPLHWAGSLKRKQNIEVLLKHGANSNIRNMENLLYSETPPDSIKF